MNTKSKIHLSDRSGENRIQPDIVQAAKYGLARDVERALTENPSCINHQDASGLTALHWACGNRDIEILTILLEHEAEKANLWVKDCRGRRAVDHAIDSGDHGIVDELKKYMYGDSMED